MGTGAYAYYVIIDLYRRVVGSSKVPEPVEPAQLPKAAPGRKYNKLDSLDDHPQFNRYINPSGPLVNPMLDTLD